MQTQNQSIVKRLKYFFGYGLWETPSSELKGANLIFTSLLRVIVSTVNGIIKNRILVQASSLSYATLLAIGPILAITILFSSMFFRDKGEHFVYEKIMDAAVFVMPAMSEMMSQHSQKTELGNSVQPEINPKVLAFIDKISKGGSSAGAIGIATMIFTCLLLCINMETAFNYIWGVHKGRNWVDRIVFYFALIFFGSVGTIFGMTFLATSQLSSMIDWIPFLSEYASWLTYLLGMGAMTMVLAFFYKFIPCVKVKWHAALVGGVIIMLLLMLNNKMSFIYISYIVKQQSFYGYFAIVAVAMFSLYIFWLFILSGGQITYAVQYVEFLSDDAAWLKTGDRTRSFIALAVYGKISAAFYGGGTAPTLESLSTDLRMPQVSIGESLNWLLEKNLICSTENSNPDDDSVYYKPSISPDSITLAEFFKRLGTNPDDTLTVGRLSAEDSIVGKAMESLEVYARSDIASKTIRELI